MTVDEMVECLLVPGLCAGDEIAVHRGFLPGTSLPAWVIPHPCRRLRPRKQGTRRARDAVTAEKRPSPSSAASATASSASPQLARGRSGHRIIAIELGPAGVRVGLPPGSSESGLWHDPRDSRVVREAMNAAAGPKQTTHCAEHDAAALANDGRHRDRRGAARFGLGARTGRQVPPRSRPIWRLYM
jgi:hypothetical protein